MNHKIKNPIMIIDASKCVGCHACEVACKQEFGTPLGVFRIMTLYLDSGVYPKVKREFLPISCRQCENAACVKACKNGALYEQNGVITINPKQCDACGECVKACEIGAIYIDPYLKIAQKCELCGHRLELGIKAACEATCVAKAITITDAKTASCIKNAKPFLLKHSETPRGLFIGANEKMGKKLLKGKNFSPLNYEIYSWAEGGAI